VARIPPRERAAGRLRCLCLTGTRERPPSGHDRSDHGGVARSLHRRTDDLRACRQLGIVEPLLFGHSMGGYVALFHAIPTLAGSCLPAHLPRSLPAATPRLVRSRAVTEAAASRCDPDPDETDTAPGSRSSCSEHPHHTGTPGRWRRSADGRPGVVAGLRPGSTLRRPAKPISPVAQAVGRGPGCRGRGRRRRPCPGRSGRARAGTRLPSGPPAS
jgi:pimeloyl-ACP methyl ester carboxylesterase